MITEYLLKGIKATAASKTIAFLVYKSIMANLHNEDKEDIR